MQYRQLGRSGLRVSALTLGTMTFGGQAQFSHVGSTGVDEARELISIALDAGVNLIDTANIYSSGQAEDILGQALSGRRDQVLLASKARLPVGSGPNDAGASRLHLIREVEASLRRLRTDHLDLYQVHEWDGQTPLEETAEALDSLIRSGKVRYVGASNFCGWQLMKALATADAHGYQRYVSQQIHYSLQSRDAEHELVPLSLDQGVGVLVWSPLAAGLLSGKYRRNTPLPKHSRHVLGWAEPPVHDESKLYDIVDALVEIGDRHQSSAARVALAWLLQRPAVTSVVIGARNAEQLQDNLAAAELALSAEEIDRLDKVSAIHLPYPHWHQAANASERLSSADLAHLSPYVR